MPEVITKHPDVVKQVLESAGARCGAGERQEILTKCPRDRFCKLPGGEICIYGVGDVGQMTQLSRAEICGARTETRPPADVNGGTTAALGLAVGLPVLAAAIVLGRARRRSIRAT